MKFQNRYPLSGMLICPYCGKALRCRQVYKKKIQWLCSTYIEKGSRHAKGEVLLTILSSLAQDES